MMTFKGWWFGWLLWWFVAKETPLGPKILWKWLWKLFWLLDLCVCVFAPESYFDVNDWTLIFGQSLEIVLTLVEKPVRLLSLWWPFILCGLEYTFMHVYFSCVCISRTWRSSLQNHVWHVHNVNMIEAFFCFCKPLEPKSHLAQSWSVCNPL